MLNRDLTKGNPASVLWKFCLPLFGSVVFQQLYNIADSFVAGRFINENALAAVGNSYEITLIFIAFGFGCNIGCSVVVSRFFGAKRFNDLKTTIYTALISTGVLCALLMVFGFLFSGKMLELIKTPADIFSDSKLYLDIYVLGLPFVLFYNIATGIFSALGDSKTPFVFLAISSTGNIAMDIFFVTVLKMGVDGVAWATFICQGISCLLALIFVFMRLSKIESEGKAEIFSWHIFKKIAVIAVPSILQQSFISVGNIVIQSIINSFGSSVTAGYAAAIKLNNLVITSFTTMGNGISNYTSQNIGAGKLDRVRSGFKAGLRLVWIICVPLFLLYFFFSGSLVSIFIDDGSRKATEVGIEFLKIVSPFYFVASMKLVSDGILRGAGKMSRFMTATFTDLVLRVVLAIVLSGFWGSTGIWLSWPVGWIVGTAVSLIFYGNGEWKKNGRKTNNV